MSEGKTYERFKIPDRVLEAQKAKPSAMKLNLVEKSANKFTSSSSQE